jgi:hypothetical protein
MKHYCLSPWFINEIPDKVEWIDMEEERKKINLQDDNSEVKAGSH